MRLRKAPAGSALTLAFAALALVAACGGESRPPCPIADDAHCDFAITIADALEDGDAEAIVALSQPTQYECPGPRVRTTELGLVCAGAEAGELRDGYPLLRLGAGGDALDESEYRELIDGWGDIGHPKEIDRYGNGTLKLASIGCATAAEGGCGSDRGVALTAGDLGSTRAVFWFVIEARPEPVIVAVAIGPVPKDCRELDDDPCRLIVGGEVTPPDLSTLTGYEVAGGAQSGSVAFVSWDR